MKFIHILLALSLLACGNSGTNGSASQQESAKAQILPKMSSEIFRQNVIVILSERLDEKSSRIHIQDYIRDGKSFIPVFTSMEKFNESTQNQVRNQVIEIKGLLLLSILNGNETLRVNPGLKDETDFNARELARKYANEITEMNNKIISNQK
jgi:hypothetical protein